MQENQEINWLCSANGGKETVNHQGIKWEKAGSKTSTRRRWDQRGQDEGDPTQKERLSSQERQRVRWGVLFV